MKRSEIAACCSCPWWVPLPFLVAVGVVPLIVYLQIIPLEGQEFHHWIGVRANWDFFAFYKARWLVFLTLIGVVFWLDSGPERVRTWFTMPLVGYALLSIASTLFADQIELALRGSPDRQEGLLVILAYVALALAGISIFGPHLKNLSALFGVVGVVSLVMGLIGAGQFFGHDLFRTPFGVQLILPERWHHLADSLVYVSGHGSPYGTLANPNYVGSFSAMVFLLTLGGLLLPSQKLRYWLIPLHLLLFVLLIGCRSKAGVLGAVIGALGLLFLGRHRLRQNVSLLVVLGCCYAFLLFHMDRYTLKHQSEMTRLLDNFQARKITHAPSLPPDFETIELATDSFAVRFRSGVLRAEHRDGVIHFVNASGTSVPYTQMHHLVVFPPGEFFGFTVKLATESKLIQIDRADIRVFFQYTSEGFRLLDGLGRPSVLREVEHWGFEGNERWGNGRGLIWSRTIPLLKKTVFLGFGPDMFLYNYPQDDFVAKIKAGYGTGWLVDKPHNMYLQIAVNTGVLSLVVLLLLFGAYLVQSVQIYWRAGFEGPREWMGASIAMAVFGYLMAGFFNDSVIGVATIFWMLLGAGIGINISCMKTAAADVGRSGISGG